MSITILLVSFDKEKIMASISIFGCDGYLTVMYLSVCVIMSVSFNFDVKDMVCTI